MPRHERLPARLGARLPAVLAALALAVTACTPSTSTAIASEGLSPQADGWRGQPVETPQSLPEVTLVDTEGQQVELDEAFGGDPTLLFFGYTSCPDICPIHLSAITSAMGVTGVTFDELDVVFVSVDPERDTAEVIEDFVANFDHRIVGLRGDEDVVEEALDQLDLPGPIVEGADPRGDGELIGHPAQVIGFDAEGTARRVWPFGARRPDWVADLPRIVDEWSGANA